jgi:DNA-binding IclR family transcriptional regulator
VTRTNPSGKGNLNPEVPLDANKKPAAVKSIYRAANILSCVSNGFNSITDIAEYCNLSKSTVHRLLKALGESKLIVQDPVSREYYLGQLISKLVTKPQITHEYLISSANKEMVHLSDVTKETICLGMMKGLQYTSLYEIPSKYQLRVVEADPDILTPVYAGAASKTLLSLLSSKELKIALKNIQIKPITGHNVATVDELWSQVKVIQRQGYCITTDEMVLGAMCISVPIHQYILPVSLSIIGPTERLRPKTDDLLEMLLSSASRISAKLAESYQSI